MFFFKSTDQRPSDHRPLTHRPLTHRPIDPQTHRHNNHRPNFKRLGNRKISILQNSNVAGKTKTILRSIMYLMIEYPTLSTCKRKQFFYKRRTAGIN